MGVLGYWFSYNETNHRKVNLQFPKSFQINNQEHFEYDTIFMASQAEYNNNIKAFFPINLGVGIHE
jgi:hypothetical protein